MNLELSQLVIESQRERVVKLNALVAPLVAEEIKNRMLNNTESGRAFGNDPYNNLYNAGYARKKGVARSPVTLRDKKKRIEKYVVTTGGKGATIELSSDREMAVIFGYHHTGKARGGKVRSIFPKQVSSVPADVKDMSQELVWEVLSGQKS